MKEIITITGDVGSGKSTVGKLLAAWLGYSHISTGKIQREIASRLGITTLQLNEASMKNREVDDEIDSYLQRLNVEGKSLVLDSRMAWHFVPKSFKVFISVDPYAGARRVLGDRRTEEVHNGIADALQNNLRRKELEDKRFAQLYGINCNALKNFDLVVDSTWVTAECVAGVIRDAFMNSDSRDQPLRAYICPKRLYPTKSPSEIAHIRTDKIFMSMKESGFNAAFPVEAIRFSNYFFLHDGHKRISCALRLGFDHVPCLLREMEEDTVMGGLKFKDEVVASLEQPWINDWEKIHEFTYYSYPDAQGNPRLT